MPQKKVHKSTEARAWKPRSHSPESLYQTFLDYVKWAEDNPLCDEVVSKGEVLTLSKVRPLSLSGFCVYADIHMQTFRNYESREEYTAYFDVCARARAIIEDHQLTGAMVGRFNPAIAARVLSLADKTDITSDGKAITSGSGVTVNVDKDALSIIRSVGRMSIPSSGDDIKTKG